MDLHSPEKKLYRRRIRETFVLFSLFVVPGLFAPYSGEGAGYTTSIVLAAIARNVAFTLLILYLADLHQESEGILGWFSSWKIVSLGVALGLFALAVVFDFVSEQFDLDGGTVVTPLPGGLVSLSGWLWLSLLMVSVAFVEEIFFRGYLLIRFQQLGLQSLPAVVVSALLFALGHGYQGISALLYSFSAGVFLGIFWIRRPNLIGFAIGHGIYNILAIIIASS